MKPYYEDKIAGIVIYHGDCREILPQLPKVDLVLTDPPYNVGMEYCDGDRRLDYKQWCADWFALLPRPIFMTTGMVNMAMWYEIDAPNWVMAWVKSNQCSPSALGGFNAWEPIFVYGKAPKRIGQDIVIQSIFCEQSDTGDHPCPKYLPAWKRIVAAISEPKHIILDPFLGSGTTAVAARILGRKCIGIEIEEKYCEIAAKRLMQSVMNLEIAPQPSEKNLALDLRGVTD